MILACLEHKYIFTDVLNKYFSKQITMLKYCYESTNKYFVTLWRHSQTKWAIWLPKGQRKMDEPVCRRHPNNKSCPKKRTKHKICQISRASSQTDWQNRKKKMVNNIRSKGDLPLQFQLLLPSDLTILASVTKNYQELQPPVLNTQHQFCIVYSQLTYNLTFRA